MTIQLRVNRAVFEGDMRLWSLQVKMAMSMLLSLGQRYQVHFTIPENHPPQVQEFGFNICAFMNSSILHVNQLFPSQFHPTITQENGVPMYVAPISAIRPSDFLLQCNDVDLLVCSKSVSHFKRDLQKQIHTQWTFHFVRLEPVIRSNPLARRSHGQILETLNKLDKLHNQLVQEYALLEKHNSQTANQVLNKWRKVLRYVRTVSLDMRNRAQEDERYNIAERLQNWYLTNYYDRHNKHLIDLDIDTSSDGSDSDDEMNVTSTNYIEGQVADLTLSNDNMSGKSNYSREPFQLETVHVAWLDAYPLQDLKWMRNAHSTMQRILFNFVCAFEAERVKYDDHQILQLCAMIGERLVQIYIHKRIVNTSGSNDSIYKEFIRHARMLVSNVKLEGNAKLREMLLSKSVDIPTLCEMTSAELAPPELQVEREQRWEKHGRQHLLVEHDGPALVKTKHGYKEVYVGNTIFSQTPEDNITNIDKTFKPIINQMNQKDIPEQQNLNNPQAGTAQTAPSSAPQNKQQQSTKEAELSDQQPTRLESSATAPTYIEVNSIHDALKQTKNVRFGGIEFEPSPPTQNTPVPAKKREIVSVSAGREFIKTLFNPVYDLESSLQQFQTTLEIAPLATMSREFEIAPGVILYRNPVTSISQGKVKIRLQLCHLLSEVEILPERELEAHLIACKNLIRKLNEFRHYTSKLLLELEQHYSIGNSSLPNRSSQQYASRAWTYLLEKGIVSLDIQEIYNAPARQFRSLVMMYKLPIGEAFSSSEPIARHDALETMMNLLSEIISARRSHLPQLSADLENIKIMDNNGPNKDYPSLSDDTDSQGVSSSSTWTPNVPVNPSQIPLNIKNPRKRKLVQSHEVGTSEFEEHLEPPMFRRRTELSMPEEQLSYVIDKVGEQQKFHDPDSELTSSQIQSQIIKTYQAIVLCLSEDIDGVNAKLKSKVWPTHEYKDIIYFNSDFQLTCSLRLEFNSRTGCNEYICEVYTKFRWLNAISYSNASSSATEDATKQMISLLYGIHSDWTKIINIYGQQKNVHLQEKIVKDEAAAMLMSAHEARSKLKNSLCSNTSYNICHDANCIEEVESPRGHLYEYLIKIHGYDAVRTHCQDERMAKRAATEDFRDLCEICLKHRIERGAFVQFIRKAQPKTSSKPVIDKNLVVCSDDDDVDDDDYNNDSFSDDDWDPSGGPINTSSKQNTEVKDPWHQTDTADATYNIASEAFGEADEAGKFRAILRVICSPTNDLFTKLVDLQQACIYRGEVKERLFPNVVVAIRMKKLRHETIAYISLNQIINCEKGDPVKSKAIASAISALVNLLSSIRKEWQKLMSFMYHKIRSTGDSLEAFRLAQLANFVPIKIDAFPSNMSFTCVVQVGNWTTSKVNGSTEANAKANGAVQAAKFIVNLLDERHEDEETTLSADATELENGDPPEETFDWTFVLRLQDPVDKSQYHEFKVDAKWVVRRDILTQAEFSTNNHLIKATQSEQISVSEIETMLQEIHHNSLKFLEINSAYEAAKLIRILAAYGNKNKRKCDALVLDLDNDQDLTMYILPPGASINSRDNLYWPTQGLPKEMNDRKKIYAWLGPKKKRSS